MSYVGPLHMSLLWTVPPHTQELTEPPAPLLDVDSEAADVDSARRGLDDLFNLYEAPRDD